MKKRSFALFIVACMIFRLFVCVNATDTTAVLYLLSGKMQSHASGGGTIDTYANNIGKSVTVVETGATVELKDDARTYQQAIERLSNINNGINATDRNLNDQVWLIDAAATYTWQFDLKNSYPITRIDIHENNYGYNKIDSVEIKAGDDPSNLTVVETSGMTEFITYVIGTQTKKSTFITLKETITARYVSVSLKSTSQGTISEIMIFGKPEQKFLLSDNVLSPADKEYYSNELGEEINYLTTGAEYSWSDDTCNTVKNNDASLNKLTNGGITTTQGVWNIDGDNSATAVFDLKKEYEVSRADVFFVDNASNGIKGKVEVYAGTTIENQVKVGETVPTQLGGSQQVVNNVSIGFTKTEARYVSVKINYGGDDTALVEMLIFGKGVPEYRKELETLVNKASEYKNHIPYTKVSWEKLQKSLLSAKTILSNNVSTNKDVLSAKENLDEAILGLKLEGGVKLLSGNDMHEQEWAWYEEKYSEIIPAYIPKTFEEIDTSVTYVSGDADIIKDKTQNGEAYSSIKHLFDGNTQSNEGNSGLWSSWKSLVPTVILYDLGEECYVNGVGVVHHAYVGSTGVNRFISDISVELSVDGKEFTTSGQISVLPEIDESKGEAYDTYFADFVDLTFPAQNARYVKISVAPYPGAVQYILKEIFITGKINDSNKIILKSEDNGVVNAKLTLDGNENNAGILISVFDGDGRFNRVVLSDELNVSDGRGKIDISTQIEIGQTAKAIALKDFKNFGPLFYAKEQRRFKEVEFSVAEIFTDGGVLQREKEVPVFGTATTGTEILVTLNDKIYKTVSDENGEWIVYLDALTDTTKTYDITVTDGKEIFEIKDMLAGDVWLCSGQSNMEYTFSMLKSTAELPDVSKYDNIRYYRVGYSQGEETPQKTQAISEENANWVESGQWYDVSTLSNPQKLSAIPLLTGIELSEYTDVPIGIISAARGSTSIEGFISRAGFSETEVEKYFTHLSRSLYFNQMINPIIPYGIKGVLWYQGCQNQGTSAKPYLGLQEALINDWRTRWSNDELPFIVTQLCTWSAGNGFPVIRDQQLALRDTTENVGVVSIMDLGDVEGTIGDNIHPIEKKEVARRISLVAKAIAYNDADARYRFPVFDKYKVNTDGSITVTFKDVYDGLVLPDGQTNVNGFKIVSGTVEYDTKTQLTDEKNVTVIPVDANGSVVTGLNPEQLKYGYEAAPYPELNLYNSEGLCAAPFKIIIK